jgi:hypothetical protein
LGRGYIVKGGQPTMIQVATPFEQAGASFASDDEAEKNAELLVRALDKWIGQVQQQYPNTQAAWSSGAAADTAQTAVAPQQSAEVRRMMVALQGFMRKEMANLNGATVANGLIISELLNLELPSWSNETVLRGLIKRAYIKEHFGALSAEVAASFVGEMSTDDFLQGIEQLLAEGDEPA